MLDNICSYSEEERNVFVKQICKQMQKINSDFSV